jgi:glycosyltransferase involved in cell wall biosynthesis
MESVARHAPYAEVIMVDGGSTDTTRSIIEQFVMGRPHWSLLVSERGRGRQMNLGAAASTGHTLLFLHADTRLPAGAECDILVALQDDRVVGGNFRIRFIPRAPVANLYTAIYNARSCLRIYYGDSAIWVRREVFEKLGRYRRERVMEDFDFVLRLRKAGLLRCLPSPVESSARRFQGGRRSVRALAQWGWLHILLLCGAGDEALDRYYPEVR